MSNLKVVDLSQTADASIVEFLEKALDRARRGEWETIFFVGLLPQGAWVTIERGKRSDKLKMIGLMESLKADLLASTETDERAI